MSPRAAWRLEAAGFDPVYDYVAGKSDWLAADLPYDGDARLVGRFARRDVPMVRLGEAVGAGIGRLEQAGFGPVVVVNDADVVMGVLRRSELIEASADAPLADVVTFGISTVRPSEQVADLKQRMTAAEVSRVVVTRSDGTLVGLFFAADVQTSQQ